MRSEYCGCFLEQCPKFASLCLEGAGQALSPQFSLAEVVQSFSGDIIFRRLSPARLLTRAQRATAYWGRALEALPSDLDDVIGRIRESSFATQIEHRRLDVITNRLVLGMVIAALLISSALLWSTKAPPLVGGMPVLGVAGYLLAVYLGWHLARAMRVSECLWHSLTALIPSDNRSLSDIEGHFSETSSHLRPGESESIFLTEVLPGYFATVAGVVVTGQLARVRSL